MEKKQFFAFVIVLLLIATFLIIRENYLQAENARMLEKITREQTEIMRHFGDQKSNGDQVVDIGDEDIPMGAPTSVADSKYEEVLRNCMSRMLTAAPILAGEFTKEAPNYGEPQMLQKLSVEKMNRLSEILSEGVAKMSEVHAKEDPENAVAYQSWIHKLMEVYEQEVEEIAKAYRMTIK